MYNMPAGTKKKKRITTLGRKCVRERKRKKEERSSITTGNSILFCVRNLQSVLLPQLSRSVCVCGTAGAVSVRKTVVGGLSTLIFYCACYVKYILLVCSLGV
jgi:hypothetical protein